MKKHPYIFTTILATLLAIVVWICVPKKYSAYTKISDEYRETDLAIGKKIGIKSLLGIRANTGMNDIEIYCQLLKTEDFARSISHMQLIKQQMTYGEYLGVTDTIETIIDNIEYSYHSKTNTLLIQFTDKDALIAAQLLDSIVHTLQHRITSYRQDIARSDLENAKLKYIQTASAYKQAQKEYTGYFDSHFNYHAYQEKTKAEELRRKLNLTYKEYKDATTDCVRKEALIHKTVDSFVTIKSISVPQTTNEHLASYILSFLSISLILVFFYQQYIKIKKERILITDFGDIFSPWILTIAIWSIVFLLYKTQGNFLYPIGPKFIKCLILWIITFIPTSIISYWLFDNPQIRDKVDFRKVVHANMNLFHFLFVLSILMTILYAKTIWDVVSMFDLDNIFLNIRLLILEENVTAGWLNYTQGVNFAVFVVAIWLYPRIPKWQLIISIIANMLLELAMMEKSGILIMILGTLFVLYEKKYIKIRTIGLSMAVIIVFFFFFNIMRSDANSTTEISFSDFFAIYVTSPIVAFDRLTITITDNFGANTFNSIYPYINKLGFNFQYINRLQEFVFVPIPTNVYTIMQPFYNDFGMRGVAFFGILYGSTFGWIYSKCRQGIPVYCCIYTFLVEVILIQFYNENLLQTAILFIEFCVIVFLLTQNRMQISTHEQTVS
ncbi:MAG: oligosaccharide repeat unit polymerase [Prevotella sp.]|nr:oligosaccharide repeat unit polymerase [Prevotella sp.]